MDDKRIDQFIEWFGESVKNDDCDPALYMINYFFDRFEFNLEQKYWYCWIYGTTYQFPTTYVIWNEFPDFHLVGIERLQNWNNKNYKRLRYQVDTKWNKGHLSNQFISYRNWVGSSTQHQKIHSFLTGHPDEDFTAMWNEAKSWHKFGRYTTWFYLQTLKHCANIPINSPTLFLDDYEGSKSHRNGLCLALGEDNLVNENFMRLFKCGEACGYMIEAKPATNVRTASDRILVLDGVDMEHVEMFFEGDKLLMILKIQSTDRTGEIEIISREELVINH